MQNKPFQRFTSSIPTTRPQLKSCERITPSHTSKPVPKWYLLNKARMVNFDTDLLLFNIYIKKIYFFASLIRVWHNIYVIGIKQILITMKNSLYILWIFIIALLGSGCSKSALSDIELQDPSLVKVSVKIAQDVLNQKEVQVFIRDRHNRPVELEHGWVEVNGREARWKRAEINSLSERGYIYYPHPNEHEFEIAIHLNRHDVYWFDINRDTGFPGFVHNGALDRYEASHAVDPFLSDSYSLYNMPFYNHKVKVSYHILKR